MLLILNRCYERSLHDGHMAIGQHCLPLCFFFLSASLFPSTCLYPTFILQLFHIPFDTVSPSLICFGCSPMTAYYLWACLSPRLMCVFDGGCQHNKIISGLVTDSKSYRSGVVALESHYDVTGVTMFVSFGWCASAPDRFDCCENQRILGQRRHGLEMEGQ